MRLGKLHIWSLAHKGSLLSFTLLVIFRRLCTLEAQQCTSQPGGSEENDNRVKNEELER